MSRVCHRSRRRVSAWCCGRRISPRRCCRSISCGFRSSRCRSAPRSPPSAARCWPSSRCPFYLESHFGYSAVQIGLLITPWPIAVAIAAPLAGRLVEHYPAGLLGGIGLLLFAAGLAHLALMPATPSAFDVIWRMALAGAGFGLFQTPNNRTMIAAAPRERIRRRERNARAPHGCWDRRSARRWWRCFWRVIRWKAPGYRSWSVLALRCSARRSAC